MLEEHLTTRQVAEALKVSESSVKRWCDNGVIPTVRTVGGHRRIPLGGFLEFLEETNRDLAAPLGGSERPSPGSAPEPAATGDPKDQFQAALAAGDETVCRSILTRAYARSESVAWIADELIATTFHALGEKWDCGEIEVYQERRGCEICTRLLHELRRLIPQPPRNGPLAIGGAPAGDQYTLPTQLVEIVLRECGWRTMNLGSNLPLDTLSAAIGQHRPRLFWLSVSHLENESQFVEAYSKMMASMPEETVVVIGGRALTDVLRPKLRYTGHCDNMQQLAAFATALHGKRHSLHSSQN